MNDEEISVSRSDLRRLLVGAFWSGRQMEMVGREELEVIGEEAAEYAADVLTDIDEREVSDGFGSTWVKCRSLACDLQVVRPGKVQCSGICNEVGMDL